MGRGLSIVAFVFSLLFFIPFVPIVGLVLGIYGAVKAKNDPTALKGLSITAIVLGALYLIGALFVLYLYQSLKQIGF